METEDAIKISLCHSVAVKAVEVLIGLMDEHADDSYMRWHASKAQGRLELLSSYLREEIEPLFDAKDEDKIIKQVCEIEDLLGNFIENKLIPNEKPLDVQGVELGAMGKIDIKSVGKASGL